MTIRHPSKELDSGMLMTRNDEKMKRWCKNTPPLERIDLRKEKRCRKAWIEDDLKILQRSVTEGQERIEDIEKNMNRRRAS